MGHYGTLDREAMVNSAHFGGCSSPESWHDPSCGTLATCRLLPNLTPSRRGGVFSFAEIGMLRVLSRHVERVFNPFPALRSTEHRPSALVAGRPCPPRQAVPSLA
jgi:hypothetical protein